MGHADVVEGGGSTVAGVLDAAARVPGVRIDRAGYLRSALKRYCTDEQIERAVVVGPAAAGVPPEVVDAAARTSIAFETTRVTGLSTLAGLPGGLAVVGAVPADLAQYVGHMLRVAQKLAYLHSWPDLFDEDADEVDEATQGMLILFVGVMVGVHVAQNGVVRVAGMVAANATKRLPRQALARGVVYPVVKKVARQLGVRMSKTLFAHGVAKVVPVVGAVLSGGLTLGTFLPMSRRLQKHLASLELTRPGPRGPGAGAPGPAAVAADRAALDAAPRHGEPRVDGDLRPTS
jgi:hypothetical protein